MKRIFINSLILIFILITGLTTVWAQESTTMQFMKGLPQSDLQNPALHNDSSKVVIGLPGLSGMYFDFSSDFAFNDLIHKGTGSLADSLVLDIAGFHNSLSETNSFRQHFSMPLFYLGIRSKKSFFSIGITEKEMAQFTFDKSLITFLKDGNAPYMGKNFDLGNLNVNAYHYSEFAFGYSRDVIGKKLSVGAKAKILFGKMAVQTNQMNLQVETAANGSYLNLKTGMNVNISGPVSLDEIEFDADNYFTNINAVNIDPVNYMTQTGNMGMAFDLGAVYKLTPRITFSGSIIDVGKISFKKENINLNHVSSYKWEGIDFSHSLDESKSDYVDPGDLADAELEKLKSTFKPAKSEFSAEAFDMSLPTKIYLGGTFSVNNHFSLGVLDCLYQNATISRNTLTFSANALLGNFFSLTGSYSMIGNSNNNLGLGVALRLGFMQLYLVSDNLMALNDPAKAEFVNARFGMNFLFGRKHKL
ncbi:MAG: DUF5723 family protein [Bacteroidota bacterium]|nr:hypothetical protein [Odoribacter sp.]MDP3642782.1 DUF5723 family protein [Bacteroidota bacterium]